MAISEQLRVRIVELKGAGRSVRQIAAELRINPSTVTRWLQRFHATGNLKIAKIKGRPRCTSADEDALIVEIGLQNVEQPVHKLRAEFVRRARAQAHARDESDDSSQEQLNVPAPSRITIGRRLRAAGFRIYIARKKEAALNTQRVRDMRLQWAGQNMWGAWSSRTVWIDESHFVSSSGHMRAVRLRKASRRGRVMVFNSVRRSGRIGLSCFGGIVGDELLPLKTYTNGFSAGKYVNILQEYWPILQEKFGTQEFRYLQDNCPVHTARAVKEWLRDNPAMQDKILQLPPYSNDLNPIEHVWARMKRMLKRTIYENVTALETAVNEAWQEISQDKRYLRALTSSMQRRINAVVAAKGGPTKY